jgi:hypothetical protein
MCREIPRALPDMEFVTTCAAIMTSACVLRVTATSNRADWTRCSGRWIHVTFTFQHGQSCGASRESELAGAHPPADTVCIQQRSCAGSGLPGFELGTADTESLRGRRRRVEDSYLLGCDARKLGCRRLIETIRLRSRTQGPDDGDTFLRNVQSLTELHRCENLKTRTECTIVPSGFGAKT